MFHWIIKKIINILIFFLESEAVYFDRLAHISRTSGCHIPEDTYLNIHTRKILNYHAAMLIVKL